MIFSMRNTCVRDTEAITYAWSLATSASPPPDSPENSACLKIEMRCIVLPPSPRGRGSVCRSHFYRRASNHASSAACVTSHCVQMVRTPGFFHSPPYANHCVAGVMMDHEGAFEVSQRLLVRLIRSAGDCAALQVSTAAGRPYRSDPRRLCHL